jgi:diketogulonate reductase-like aldo/keto reductase
MEYVDLYSIHWPQPNINLGKKLVMGAPIHKTWSLMEKMTERGQVKSIGLSNFNFQSIADLMTYCEVRPAVNQVECHPYLQKNDLKKFCNMFNINLTAYSPIGTAGWPYKSDEASHKILLSDPVILELGEKHGKTASQIILNWHLKNGHSCIPKTTKEERLKENIESIEFDLSVEDIEKINKLDCGLRYVDTRNIGGPFANMNVFG